MGSGVGLFGKTQFRRDFLSVGLPRPLVSTWETWLARGLARSREHLGAGWMPLFLTMPVWHAALGRSLCGVAAVVATMPSMDGAGRCFPLSAFAWCDDPEAAVSAAAVQAWSAAAEAFLLGTLDDTGSHEAVLAELARLPAFPAADNDEPAVGAGDSLWWTGGGERHAPERFSVGGMPDEEALTTMIGHTPAPLAGGEEHRHVG